MNSKRYIPLIVIGALILSLLAVIPAFGAGQVSFIDPSVINDNGTLSDSTPDEQEWGRQGGEIGLMLEDDSLDVPVRRVLIPDADTTEVGTNVDIEAQSATLTLPRGAVAKDDYVMVGDRNVRKVESVKAGVVQTASTADLGLTAGDTTLTTPHTFAISVTGATKADKLTSLAVDPALPGFLKLTSTPAAAQSLALGGKVSVTIDLADNLTKNPVIVTALDTYAFTATATKTADDTTLTSDPIDVTIEVQPKDTDDTVTLDTPFAQDGDDLAVHKINDSITKLDGVDWADNYALYARAIKLIGKGEDKNTDVRGDYTRHNTKYLIVDSDIASTSDTSKGSDLHRLTGGGSGRVNESDALVVTVTQVGNQDPTYIPHGFDNLDDDQVLFDANSGADQPIDKLKVYLAAWFEEPNDTGSMVSVRSQAHQDPTTVVLRETGPGSGNFALKIEAVKFGEAADKGVKVPDLSATIPTLPVNPRDVVTLSGPDSTATVTIETTKPVFTGLSPAHNTSGRDSRPDVSAQVTDGDSGLTDSNIKVLFHVEETGESDKNLEKIPEKTGDVDEISGGFEVTEQLSGADETPEGDATISWWVMATDDAGNVGFSDRVLSKDGAPDTCTATEIPADYTLLESASKCQPYIIMVDDTDPELLRAETGRNWNSGLSTGDSDDKTEYRVSKAAKDVVLVVFDEHLDARTVSTSDFRVDGSQPVDADVRNVTVRDDSTSGDGNSAIAGDGVPDPGQVRGYVFLTLASDLLPNARPKVELVDDIADLAGNNQNTGRDNDADDRVAPKLTVTIDEGVRPVTKGKINLTITSDENIGTPSVTYYEVTSSDGEATVKTDKKEATVKFVSATRYLAEIDAGSDEDGLFTILVEAADSAGGNKGSTGDASGEVDVDGITSATLFEHDEKIGDPDVNPDMDDIQDEFEIDDPNAFIRIDFSAEGNEYDDTMEGTGDAATRVGDDLDNHASVTIVSATLGGMDIKDDLQSNDASNIFLYKAAGLALGEHKLEVTAEDEAGNRHPSPAEATITIIERKPYSLKLNPGWNLVSIPGEPAVTDINTVIPYADNPDIISVTTYDPSVPGFWLTATRGADNMFTGTLTNITSTRGYLVETTSFKPLSVNIPKQSLGAMLLPGITIVKGWNLVPILDVNGDFKLEFNTEAVPGKNAAGEATADVNYFSGLTANDNAVGIYTFNTVTGSWTSVKPQDVEIGKAYWIYAEKEGVIIP